MHPSDFATLYYTSVPHIRHLVFSITKNQQALEDIVQDIYLAAWLRFRNDTHPNPMGWLLLTARHKAYDLIRRQLRESQFFLSQDLTSDTTVINSGLYSPDPHLDTVCEDQQPYAKIRCFLRKEELELLLEYYDDRLSINEIAAKRHISPSACHMRLHRARKKLEPLVSHTPS